MDIIRSSHIERKGCRKGGRKGGREGRILLTDLQRVSEVHQSEWPSSWGIGGYWVGGGPGVEGAQEEGEEGYLSRQRQCGCPGRRRRSLGLSMTRVWSSILTYCD